MTTRQPKDLEALAAELRYKTSEVLKAHGFDAHELAAVTFAPVARAEIAPLDWGCRIVDGHIVCD